MLHAIAHPLREGGYQALTLFCIRQACAVRRGRASETSDAKSKRHARTVAEPVLDAGWSLEYSVHKLTPATMEDARVCFQNELDEEMARVSPSVGAPPWL